MQSIFGFLLIGALALLALILLFGVINMVRRGGDPKRSNKLMRWRIGLQLLALIIIAALFFLQGK